MIHLIIKCNKCGRTQGYECRSTPKGKYKKCVYCGKSFLVHKHIAKESRIIEIFNPQEGYYWGDHYD